MRRNRTKTRKTSKNNYGTIIVFLVLLFVGAPTIGYFGTKYILIPKYFSKPVSDTVNNASTTNTEKLRQKIEDKIQDKTEDKTKESNNTDEKVEANKEQLSAEKMYTFDLPALNIYSIQVGSFDNKQHAEKQISELNSKGLGGYILASDRFRVIAMSFTDRSSAEKFKNKIKDNYSDAFISPKQLSTRAIKYGEVSKEYSQAAQKGLNELMEYYKNFSNFLAEKDVLNGNADEIVQFVDSEINRLQGITKSITVVDSSEDFTNFKSKLSGLVDTAKTNLMQSKQSNFSDRKKLFEIYMESINSYADII